MVHVWQLLVKLICSPRMLIVLLEVTCVGGAVVLVYESAAYGWTLWHLKWSVMVKVQLLLSTTLRHSLFQRPEPRPFDELLFQEAHPEIAVVQTSLTTSIVTSLLPLILFLPRKSLRCHGPHCRHFPDGRPPLSPVLLRLLFFDRIVLDLLTVGVPAKDELLVLVKLLHRRMKLLIVARRGQVVRLHRG